MAKQLGVCRATVYQLCARGELRHVRVGNAIRVPKAWLEEYLGKASGGSGSGAA